MVLFYTFRAEYDQLSRTLKRCTLDAGSGCQSDIEPDLNAFCNRIDQMNEFSRMECLEMRNCLVRMSRDRQGCRYESVIKSIFPDLL